jgi:general secretion pathway protein K
MRPELYRRLAPFITVYSRSPAVNAQLAAREVLLAIPGATPEVVDDYITRREAARAAGQPLPVFPQPSLVSGFTMVASIRSEAQLDNGTVFVREAVAILRPAPRKPVTFLAWRQPSLALPADAPANPSPATTSH